MLLTNTNIMEFMKMNYYNLNKQIINLTIMDMFVTIMLAVVQYFCISNCKIVNTCLNLIQYS